jgi:hypothetical protein
MRDAASLLERKRKLLARRQEGNVKHLAAVERTTRRRPRLSCRRPASNSIGRYQAARLAAANL